MPPEVEQFAATHLKDPLRIEVAPSGTVPEKIEQELFVVENREKFWLLEKLVAQHTGSIIVFCNQRWRTEKFAKALRSNGHNAAEIHKECDQKYRTDVLRAFKEGEVRILVATDLAGRGLDIPAVELVVIFDLPHDPNSYPHRIGRTGRAGLGGKAIIFATPDEVEHEIPKIEKLIGKQIPRSETPKLE